MLLALDVGNTEITVGLFHGTDLEAHWRLTTNPDRTPDEWGSAIGGFLVQSGHSPNEVRAVCLASVAPPVTQSIVEGIARSTGCTGVTVDASTPLPVTLDVDEPLTVGADRIVNAVAAFERIKGAVIVVDFGTATTFDCISPKGEYLGGVIVPGVQVSLDGLLARAAKLTRVELAAPPHVLGRNTTHALQSGVVFGYASMIDGMVARLEAELGYSCHIMATGGLSTLIAKHTTRIQEVDVNLTLDGLCLLHERNASAAEAAEAHAAKRRAERTR